MKTIIRLLIISSFLTNINGSDWAEIGSPTAMTGENGIDQAGISVAMSADGTRVAVGESAWSGGSENGRVRVYQYTADNWIEIGSPTAMTGQNGSDAAGTSVAMSDDGTKVAVGESFWNGGNGRVRVYQYTAGDWIEIGSPTAITGQNGSDRAGFSTAISDDGTNVAVGEYGWSGLSGRVRVYQYTAGDWVEIGSTTAMTGQNGNDRAGTSVAISDDGTNVAVGEYGWSGFSGRVRAYQYTAGDWIEIGSPTAMTGQNGDDAAGRSVAMSDDGTKVAVGEYAWSGGSENGRVRVYTFLTPNNKNDNNEFYIRNNDLAAICYFDISHGTNPGHKTNPAGLGQGAVFTPYRIEVRGR